MDKKTAKKKITLNNKPVLETTKPKNTKIKTADKVNSQIALIDNLKKLPSRTDESIRDSLRAISGILEPSNWGDEEGEEEEPKLPIVLSRTSYLIQDYREFKAARAIQTIFRGWYTRRMLAKKKKAATVIQTAWRGFAARRFYYLKLENKLQQRIERHYYNATVKIQAYWRGIWVRETVHDQFRKKRMQMRAAEDLLHCVAFKLHHLLRTHQIPGIYSLRSSNCLSKVEKLLYAIQFRQYNDRVRKLRAQREQLIQTAKCTHKESAYATQVPYAGPNFSGLCEPKCCELLKNLDADAKMFKILSLYERAARHDYRISRVRERTIEKRKSSSPRRRKKRSDFCGDVIKSMKKWKIIQTNVIKFNKDVFKNPENVEQFLTEMQAYGETLQPRCHCNMNIEQLMAEVTVH